MIRIVFWLVCGVAAGYLTYRHVSHPRKPGLDDYAMGLLCTLYGCCALVAVAFYLGAGKLEKKYGRK